VRDGIREYTSKLLENCANSDEAWTLLQAHQDEMISIAREITALYGRESQVQKECFSEFSGRLGVYPRRSFCFWRNKKASRS
jgi:hypothetical protein